MQASKSIEKYGVHAVVANILETRKEVVQLVRPTLDREQSNSHSVHVDEILRGSDQFIEAPLVHRLVRLHQDFQGNQLC